MMTRLKVGLIGLGRLGRVYARDLSSRIAEARLVAVADTNGALAGQIAAEFDVPRAFDDPMELLHSTDVDAAVIASPPHTHKALVIAPAGSWVTSPRSLPRAAYSRIRKWRLSETSTTPSPRSCSPTGAWESSI